MNRWHWKALPFVEPLPAAKHIISFSLPITLQVLLFNFMKHREIK